MNNTQKKELKERLKNIKFISPIEALKTHIKLNTSENFKIERGDNYSIRIFAPYQLYSWLIKEKDNILTYIMPVGYDLEIFHSNDNI